MAKNTLECARPTLPVNLIFNKSILQGGYERLLQEKRSPSKDFLLKHPQILVYNSQIKPSKEPGHKIYVPDHHTKEKNLVLIDKSIASETHLELCLVRPKNRPIGVTARSVWNAFQKRSTQGR